MHPGLVATIFLGLNLLSSLLCGGSRPGRDAPRCQRPALAEVIVEAVHFQHGSDLLAGSLYRPGLPGRHPAVALVLGSGSQDRGYGGMGPALGRHFARHGILCLTWDKPGVGQSTGDFNAQTFQDRAEEALAAVRFLRERPDAHADQVGLWGHSQGGMVVPLAAALAPDVAFVIEVSGWQGAAWQQDIVRVESELRHAGKPAADIREATAFARLRMDLIRGTGPYEALAQAQETVKTRPWFPVVHWCDRTLFYAARRMVNYDSEPSWEKVHCPVLAIYGDRDRSSGPPKPLVTLIRRGLKKADNRDVTIRIFPDADHSLCRAGTKQAKEAGPHADKGENPDAPDFVSDYLDLMSNWLAKRFPAGAE